MLKLGYLAFAVRRPARWDAFCRTMLGLPEPVTNLDGSLGYALDGEVRQRLIVEEGKADDLAAIGLDCADDAGLDALLARLRRRASPPSARPAALGNARRVARLHLLSDPDGQPHRTAQPAPRRPTSPSPRPRCRAAIAPALSAWATPCW